MKGANSGVSGLRSSDGGSARVCQRQRPAANRYVRARWKKNCCSYSAVRVCRQQIAEVSLGSIYNHGGVFWQQGAALRDRYVQ